MSKDAYYAQIRGLVDEVRADSEKAWAECDRLRAALEAAERGRAIAEANVRGMHENTEALAAERDALKEQVEVAREALQRIADESHGHGYGWSDSLARAALARLDQRETQ